MKRIIAISLLLLTIASLALNVASASDYDAKLDIKYEVNSSGNIVVTASLNNINVKHGVSDCEYDIKYNDSDLKLVNFTVNVPDSWKSDFDNGDGEDFSHKGNNGTFNWAIFNATPLKGITQNDQLYIVLEFEPRNNKTTEIFFEPVVVATDVPIESNGDILYDLAAITVNGAKISVDLNSKENPNIDANVSVSENSVLPPHTSMEEFVSAPGGPNELTKAPGTIGMPNVNQSSVVDNNNNGGNVLWIVIIVIVVVVCVAATVYVLIISKSKGDKND